MIPEPLRIELAKHAFGLCRRIHIAEGPEAEKCIACATHARPRGKKAPLCPTCQEKKT